MVFWYEVKPIWVCALACNANYVNIKNPVAVMFILSTMFLWFLTSFKMNTSLICCPSICFLIFNIIFIHVISFKNLKLKTSPLHCTGRAGALERLWGVLRQPGQVAGRHGEHTRHGPRTQGLPRGEENTAGQIQGTLADGAYACRKRVMIFIYFEKNSQI